MKCFDLMLEQQLADESAPQNSHPWALLCAGSCQLLRPGLLCGEYPALFSLLISEQLSASLSCSRAALKKVLVHGVFCPTLGHIGVLNFTTTERGTAPIFRTLIQSLSNAPQTNTQREFLREYSTECIFFQVINYLVWTTEKELNSF